MRQSRSGRGRNPLVSVIIPVFRPNRRFLTLAIRSLLDQTFHDFEIIIIEDPSDLPAADVLSQFTDQRIRHHVNQHRTSLPRQHNLGLQKAHGRLLSRFDCDDICEREKLETQVRFLQNHPDMDVVGTNLLVIDDDDRVLGERRYPEEHDSIMKMFPCANPIANPTVMFRRETFDRFGGWNEDSTDPAQDYEWFSRLARGGARFANVQTSLVRYRLHPGAIKRQQLRGTLRTTIRVKKDYWKEELGPRAALILAVEHLLLLLPSSLVYRLFLLLRHPGTRL